MKLSPLLLASTLAVLGCEGTVTRTLVVDARTAESLGSRAEVVTRNGDTVRVVATFRRGDTIPGEGVVRTGVSWPALGVGLVLMTASVAVAALSSTCRENEDPWLPFACPVSFDVLAALVGILGSSMTIGSLNARAYVEPKRASFVVRF